MNPNDPLDASWRRLEASGDELAAAFYETLFAIHPEAASLLADADPPTQRRMLLAALRQIIAIRDDPRQLVRFAADLGRRHAELGIGQPHYHAIGVAWTRTVERVLGEACTAEIRTAWVDAYELVSAVMLRAVRVSEARTPR